MSLEGFFRFLFVILFSCLTLIRVYFKIKARVFWERFGTREEGFPLLLAQVALGIPLAMASAYYVVFPEKWRWAYLSLPAEIRWAGAPLGVAALFLLVWTHLALGRNFNTGINVKPGQTLVRSGPYRLIRHPIYVAYVILFLSAFLITQNWVIIGFGLAVVLLLMTFRLQMEEAILLSQFGEAYRSYQTVTPKFVPRPSHSRRGGGVAVE